jgi:hypothetical protein
MLWCFQSLHTQEDLLSTMVVWHVLLSAVAAGNVVAAYISDTVLFYPLLCVVMAGLTLNLSVATLFATFECIALQLHSRVRQLLQVWFYCVLLSLQRIPTPHAF